MECDTGKQCYPSKPDAERAMTHIKRYGKVKNAGQLRRAYRCRPGCGFWHVTSVDSDEWDYRD